MENYENKDIFFTASTIASNEEIISKENISAEMAHPEVYY